MKKTVDELTGELQELREKYNDLERDSSIVKEKYNKLVNSLSYKLSLILIIMPCKILSRTINRISQVLKFICRCVIHRDFQAIYQAIRRVYFKCLDKITQPFVRKRKLSFLKEEISKKKIVIFPPSIDWHMPLFQRPQQLALAYAKQKNIVVIYMTSNSRFDSVNVVEEVAKGVFLFNDSLKDYLKEVLCSASKVILSISWTYNKSYIDLLNPDKVIYEYIDELNIFAQYGPEMEKDHIVLAAKADVLVCTATKLFNQAKDLSKNALLSTNAGDYNFFVNTNKYPIDTLIKGKYEKFDCVIGYYGSLAEWVDYDLIKEVAKKRRNWLWILVGVDYDGSLKKSRILEYKNILYIPPQPYKKLPGFLKAFDVATIPFKINEITLSTSPVKLFEYMASGKPIVTSKLPECLKYQSVWTYSTTEECIKLIEKAVTLQKEDPYWTILSNDAKNNTWDVKAIEILHAINEI